MAETNLLMKKAILDIDNLSDEEIIAQSEEFAPLLEELKGRTITEYKKCLKFPFCDNNYIVTVRGIFL